MKAQMPKGLLVQKFGGTSLQTPDLLKSAAEKVLHYCQLGWQVVVVVSAMGDHTDKLLALAREIHPSPTPREVDMLLTTGERVSAALMALALEAHGQRALSLTGSQCGILTSQSHGQARIHDFKPWRIQNALEKGYVVVVAGFQGVSDVKDITTLGRGGSDLTAVALTVALRGQLCQIYKDVPGICQTDPRLYPSAKVCAHLTWTQATKLAQGGACVLHHRAANLALRAHVPLEIRSSFMSMEEKFTKISDDVPKYETPIILGFERRNNLVKVSFEAGFHTVQIRAWLLEQDHQTFRFWRRDGRDLWCFSREILEEFEKKWSPLKKRPVYEVTVIGHNFLNFRALWELAQDVQNMEIGEQFLIILDEDESKISFIVNKIRDLCSLEEVS